MVEVSAEKLVKFSFNITDCVSRHAMELRPVLSVVTQLRRFGMEARTMMRLEKIEPQNSRKSLA